MLAAVRRGYTMVVMVVVMMMVVVVVVVVVRNLLTLALSDSETRG